MLKTPGMGIRGHIMNLVMQFVVHLKYHVMPGSGGKTFNPNIQEGWGGRSLSLRPARSTELVPG